MFANRIGMALLFFILVLGSTFVFISETDAGVSVASNAANITEIARLTAFLDEATAYVIDSGKEKALLEFNNRSGEFVRGDLYIYAYDFNGTNLAHPLRPDLVRRDQRGLVDINGVAMIKNELALAKDGGGLMYLVFSNPLHDDREELKLTYIKKVDANLWLGSGIYLSQIPASLGQQERDELVAFVEDAVRFAHENGKEMALQDFSDPKGNFSRGELYIFAYDYDGLTLAHPYQPELIGKSRINARDPNGIKINQQAVNAAKFGNGFFYYIYPDPFQNMTQVLKLGYVADVDGTWYLGSGIYANGDK
ncbi:MAG: Cache domain protein [Methanosaeta sp. PtaU1.Bin112]|nr:MAG: Cache domain protein [Methanosaeta sp. PtaU1.Bin112]